MFNNRICYSGKAGGNDQKLSGKTEIQIIDIDKSTNLSETWSKKQMPKYLAMKGARFETVNIERQPNPTPAIELISKVPVIELHENIVACDGGGGRLGHPTIYINLVRRIISFLARINLLPIFRIKNGQFLVLIADCVINKNSQIKYIRTLLFYKFITILSNNSNSIALVSVFSVETKMLVLKIWTAKLNFKSFIEE